MHRLMCALMIAYMEQLRSFPIDSLTSFGIKMSDNFGIILGMSP